MGSIKKLLSKKINIAILAAAVVLIAFGIYSFAALGSGGAADKDVGAKAQGDIQTEAAAYTQESDADADADVGADAAVDLPDASPPESSGDAADSASSKAADHGTTAGSSAAASSTGSTSSPSSTGSAGSAGDTGSTGSASDTGSAQPAPDKAASADSDKKQSSSAGSAGSTGSAGDTGSAQPAPDKASPGDSGDTQSGSTGSAASNSKESTAKDTDSKASKPAEKPIEKPADKAPEPKKPTATLSIDCLTLLDHMDELDKAKAPYVGSGIIMAKRTVTFTEGESVFDVLYRECRASGIHMSSKFTPIYNSAYIEGINQIYEFDCGSLSGWMYKVNGWYPNYGCSQYILKQGDAIEWRYTTNLGKDVGGSV